MRCGKWPDRRRERTANRSSARPCAAAAHLKVIVGIELTRSPSCRPNRLPMFSAAEVQSGRPDLELTLMPPVADGVNFHDAAALMVRAMITSVWHCPGDDAGANDRQYRVTAPVERTRSRCGPPLRRCGSHAKLGRVVRRPPRRRRLGRARRPGDQVAGASRGKEVSTRPLDGMINKTLPVCRTSISRCPSLNPDCPQQFGGFPPRHFAADDQQSTFPTPERLL